MLNINRKLEQRKLTACYRKRQLYPRNSLINFSNNDYLDLSQDSRIIHATQQALLHYGISQTASALVSGYTQLHQRLEQDFADFLQRDRALIFINGFTANLSILTTLAQRHDIILQERQCHASLAQAAQLSLAKHYRFTWQKPLQLQQLLEQMQRHCFIVSDSVLSTTGKTIDIKAISQVAKQYQATLLVDDAHGIGILGKHGGGISEQLQLQQSQLPLLVCPLAKAFGCYGAIVAGSESMIEALIQFAKPYIYSTAIPAAMIASIQTSLNIVRQECWRRQKLLELSNTFNLLATQMALPFIDTQTPIKSLRINTCEQAISLQRHCLQQGYITTILRPPSSGGSHTLLRISLSCRHDKKQLYTLLQTVREGYV